MLPGIKHSMNIVEKDIAMKKIEIKVKNRVVNAQITVTKLDTKPATIVHEITGKVYQYLEITTNNIEDDNIEEASIQFEVSKSWINENNIDSTTVKLYRYTTTWEALDTTLVNETTDSYVYEATTPGFSTFAIGGETKTITTTTTIVTTTIPPTTTLPEEVTTTVPTTTIPPTTTTLPVPKKKPDYTWIIIFIIVIIVGIGIFYRNRIFKKI
jgi:PGF-pre-PGF domain-containing protein